MFSSPTQNKFEALGTPLNPSHIMKRGGDWYITDPQMAGRSGYFSIVAEWCGWCKKLAASMQQARRAYGVTSLYLDGDSALGKPLARAMDVQGFPTMFTFDKYGKLSPYEGDRSPAVLGNYLSTYQSGGSASSWW